MFVCYILMSYYVLSSACSCSNSQNCTTADLGEFSNFWLNGSVVLGGPDIVLIESEVVVPGNLVLSKGAHLLVGGSLTVCGNLIMKEAEMTASNADLYVYGSMEASKSKIKHISARTSVEGSISLKKSEILQDKKSHISTLKCLLKNGVKFSLIVYSQDILSIAVSTSNKDFKYGSYTVVPMNYSCTLGERKFTPSELSLPAYTCTNITNNTTYNGGFFEVEVQVGIGADNCRSIGLSLAPCFDLVLILILLSQLFT